MKKIPLTQGLFAVVDDRDFGHVNSFKWCANKGAKNKTAYAVRGVRLGGKYRREFMHRVILEVGDNEIVDHINHDTLDNRRGNLRIGVQKQNLLNREGNEGSSSKYKGVSLHKKTGKWAVKFMEKTAGYYDLEDDAARVYNALAFKNDPNWALLNKIEGLTKEQSIQFPESYHPRVKKNKYRGVRKRSANSFEASITIQKKRMIIGNYPTEELAIQAYNSKCDELGVSKRKNIVSLSNVA